MDQTPAAPSFAPYRDPMSGRVMLAEVTKQGHRWVDARGLHATSSTVRPTRAAAWALADRKYPNLPQHRAANED